MRTSLTKSQKILYKKGTVVSYIDKNKKKRIGKIKRVDFRHKGKLTLNSTSGEFVFLVAPERSHSVTCCGRRKYNDDKKFTWDEANKHCVSEGKRLCNSL